MDIKASIQALETKLANSNHKYQELKKIVDTSSMRKVDGRTIDLTTASMLVQIADKLNAENREKFLNLPIVKMIDVGWKLVKKK